MQAGSGRADFSFRNFRTLKVSDRIRLCKWFSELMDGFPLGPCPKEVWVEKGIGGLSKPMIDNDSEGLNEGGKYPQAFDNSLDPEDRKEKTLIPTNRTGFNEFST